MGQLSTSAQIVVAVDVVVRDRWDRRRNVAVAQSRIVAVAEDCVLAGRFGRGIVRAVVDVAADRCRRRCRCRRRSGTCRRRRRARRRRRRPARCWRRPGSCRRRRRWCRRRCRCRRRSGTCRRRRRGPSPSASSWRGVGHGRAVVDVAADGVAVDVVVGVVRARVAGVAQSRSPSASSWPSRWRSPGQLSTSHACSPGSRGCRSRRCQSSVQLSQTSPSVSPSASS